MVLKRSGKLILGVILLLCTTGNGWAQEIEEVSYSDGLGYFQRLDSLQNDSTKYACELFSLAKYCRMLGMYQQCKKAGSLAQNILNKVYGRTKSFTDDSYDLLTKDMELSTFLLDISIGRGNPKNDYDSLYTATLYSIADESTMIHCGSLMADSAFVFGNKLTLKDIYNRFEFPLPEQLDIATRALWELGRMEEVAEIIARARRKKYWKDIPKELQYQLSLRELNAQILPGASLEQLNKFVEGIPVSDCKFHLMYDFLYEQKLPEFYSVNRELARAYLRCNQPQLALEMYNINENLLNINMKQDFSFLLPAELHDLWEIMRIYFEEMQLFTYQHRHLEGSVPLLYHNTLFIKEVFANSSFQYHKYLSQADSTHILNMQSRIDSLAFDKNTFKTQLPEDYLKQLQNEVLRRVLERELIYYVRKKTQSSTFKVRQWNEVAASLDDDEAVIELISLPGKVYNRTYVAIVFSKHDKQPHLVTLPTENEMQRWDKDGKTLYTTVWLPIKKVIGNCKRLYISSHETMSFLSFASIHYKDDYLLDKYDIRYLFTSNDIPRLKSEQRSAKSKRCQREIFLFGGAEFNYNLVTKTYRSNSAQGFQYLQGTTREIKSIKNVLSPQLWTVHEYAGRKATATDFLNLSHRTLSSSAVIHIATHGFYNQYNYYSKSDSLQFKGLSGHKNPLLRSGLAFTGADYAWNSPSPMRTDDGILTAYEIESMNLSGTELVVLSGCNTGKGEIRNGEGVFGLQHAFRQAGVKSQILSFNTVTDDDTAELMADFYRYWQKGASKHQAFRKAQQNMKKRNPFQPEKWASFILIE